MQTWKEIFSDPEMTPFLVYLGAVGILAGIVGSFVFKAIWNQAAWMSLTS